MKPVFYALFLVCFPPLGNVKKLKRKYIERMRQKCPNSLKSVESSAAAVQKVRENKVNNRGNGAYKSGNLEPGDSKAGPPSPNITYEHFECFFLWIHRIFWIQSWTDHVKDQHIFIACHVNRN